MERSVAMVSTAGGFSLVLPAAHEQSASVSRDLLLQASQRLDWRFLLPDPNLGHVAYVGAPHGALFDALRLLSSSLAVMSSQQICAAEAGRYHVVVAPAPAFSTLQQCARLIEPGTFLYVEASRAGLSMRLPGRARLYDAPSYVAALGRLGLDDVQTYWHWPDFEACTMITPLDDQAALLYAFRRHSRGTAARLKAMLGRLMVMSRMFAHVAPSFSVLATRHRPA